MIPLILTAELDTEFNREWNEAHQFVVIKLADIVVARFRAISYIEPGNERPGLEWNAAEWLRRKLI